MPCRPLEPFHLLRLNPALIASISKLLYLLAVIASFNACSMLPERVTSLTSKLPAALRFSSLSQEVHELVTNRRYAEARRKLDEAGAGEFLLASAASKDRIQARQAFQVAIERDFVAAGRQATEDGKPRRAVDKLNEGLQLCPWSDTLQAARRDATTLVLEIDALGAEAKTLSARRIDLDERRDFLRRVQSRRRLLTDSPEIEATILRLEENLVSFWVTNFDSGTEAADANRLDADLLLLGMTPNDRAAIREELALARRLRADARIIRDGAVHDSLITVVRTSGTDAIPPSIRPLRMSVRANLMSVTDGAVSTESRRADLTPGFVDLVEHLIDSLPDGPRRFAAAAAAAHIARARQLAGSGRAAAIALIHLDRARQLEPGLSTEGSIRSLAEASFAAAGQLPFRVSVETNPTDEPVLQDLVRYAVGRAVRQRARPHIRIISADDLPSKADLQVSLTSITMFVPSMADLNSVTSRYVSHYEEAPNPRKAALKQQLEFQRISVDIAKSSYNSAVSSFNIYPTEFGLTSVNLARTRYNNEVDQYNFIVNLYNATPVTITRPVHLPYAFHEGTVRHGWRLRGSVSLGARKEDFSLEDVDSEFIRLGSRRDDVEVKYRRESPLSMAVGTDRLITQLAKVVERLTDEAAETASFFRPEMRVDVSGVERELIDDILRPLSGGARGGVAPQQAKWATGAARGFSMPRMAEMVPPRLKLSVPGKRVVGGTPTQIAASYESAVALIRSGTNVLGSGALVSKDGLIITAAHVLPSDSIDVVFPGASRDKHFRGEIVRVNDKHDVALIRAVGYSADRWFELALSEPPVRGEPVIAIGNPAIGSAGTAVNAVSTGIVAKPYEGESERGLTGLVADITVASGSSGGPLISVKTGKIIGVITTVVAPTVSKDFAASGYWAVSAPSTQLTNWLGLTYGP